MPAAGVSRLTRPRSLGARLVLILTGIGLAAATAITLLLGGIITPSFRALENQRVEVQLQRTRVALSDFAGKVETAAWNHAERSNAADTRASLQQVIAGTDLHRLLGGGRSTAFYARLDGRVAAVGVARVRGGDGFVVMARVLTAVRLSSLVQMPARLAQPGSGQEVERSSNRITIAVPLLGANGRPVASARLQMARDVSVLGRRMLLLAVAGSILLLLLLLMVLRRAVAQMVLEPLGRVEQHMQHVRVSGSLDLLAVEDRRDEIGSLSRSFNGMLRQLKDLREQIEVQSFAMGRSESAVAVMHNVRNALNPVSTILSHGLQQTPAIDRAVLDRALSELVAADLPEARRRKLVAFVLGTVEAADAARLEQRHQLAIGREAMAHALEIIGQQQAQAHERPLLGEVDVTEVIAHNATIARYSDGCSVALSFPAQSVRAYANRVILSQVIGNLFSNAAEAIAATGRNSGSIAVTIAQEREHVIIRIRDDGEGFDPEAAPALFQRGFSTRPQKSGGLGLHWCANSMVAMDGTLALASEGTGRGALAVLTLRAAKPLAVAA